MSESERKKWDARYKNGSRAVSPSEWLRGALEGAADTAATPLTESGGARALDVACGTGRNALWLGAQGFHVDALDISPVALEHARRAASRAGQKVNWIQADLDLELPVSGPYQLIVVIRYLNLSCLTRLQGLLAPGGKLMVEVFLDPEGLGGQVASSANPAFRAAPGALRAALSELEIVSCEEGLFDSGRGRREALARLIAERG